MTPLAKIVAKVESSGEPFLISSREGKPVAMVIRFDEYERMLEAVRSESQKWIEATP